MTAKEEQRDIVLAALVKARGELDLIEQAVKTTGVGDFTDDVRAYVSATNQSALVDVLIRFGVFVATQPD